MHILASEKARLNAVISRSDYVDSENFCVKLKLYYSFYDTGSSSHGFWLLDSEIREIRLVDT